MPMRSQGGAGGIAPTHLQLGHEIGISGEHHGQANLTPGKNPVHIVQEAGLASGPVWTDTENLTPPGFGALTVRAVTIRSLYIPVSYKEVSACFLVPL